MTIMNESMSDVNNTVPLGQSEIRREEDNGLRIALAVIYCVLGSAIVIVSALLVYKVNKLEKHRTRKWDAINRAISKLIAGALLLPVCAILVLNESDPFLSSSSCYVLLGLQLFAFIGHHLCGYLGLTIVRISVVYPLRSTSILSGKCLPLSIFVLWSGNVLFVTVSELVFVLQSNPEAAEVPVSQCSWAMMYPKHYLFTVIYAITIVGHLAGLFAVLRIYSVVKHHRTQIEVQTRVAGSSTEPKAKTFRLNSPKCMFMVKVAPVGLLMLSATACLLVHLHCRDCIPKPWDMFAVWFLWGLAVLGTALVMISSKHDQG